MKKNKIVISLTIIIISLLSIFVYIYYGRFRFTDIRYNASLNRFDRKFDKEISTSKLFAELFFRSYISVIKKEINQQFYDEFLLSQKSISARLLLSATSETFIYFYPATRSELIVDCSAYPVQLSLLSGLDTPSSEVKLNVSIEELLFQYRANRGMFHLDNTFMTISAMTLIVPFPKIFSFSNHSILILDNVALELRDINNKIRSIHINDFGIMTGESDFSFALEKAGSMGRDFAGSRISGLFIRSNLFREFLTYKHLRPLAEEIFNKTSRSAKDPSFIYPLWKVKNDIYALKIKANKIGVDTKYIDELFKDPSLISRDGVLLYYYKDYIGFAMQWVAINLILFIILWAYMCYSYKMNIKMVATVEKYRVRPVAVLSINAWAFQARPQFIDYKYWIIPGIIFIACIILSVCSPRIKIKK